jgi:hypothetical protein
MGCTVTPRTVRAVHDVRNPHRRDQPPVIGFGGIGPPSDLKRCSEGGRPCIRLHHSPVDRYCHVVDVIHAPRTSASPLAIAAPQTRADAEGAAKELTDWGG